MAPQRPFNESRMGAAVRQLPFCLVNDLLVLKQKECKWNQGMGTMQVCEGPHWLQYLHDSPLSAQNVKHPEKGVLGLGLCRFQLPFPAS